MKRLFILLFGICCLSAAQAGPTPFSNKVDSMWLNGDKKGVLAIAEKRLQSNPTDIVGLLIRMQYAIVFSDTNGVKTAMDRVLFVGDTIKTPHFAAIYPKLKSDFVYMETKVLPGITPEMVRADVGKGLGRGIPMEFLLYIKAAELDGLIKLDGGGVGQ